MRAPAPDRRRAAAVLLAAALLAAPAAAQQPAKGDAAAALLSEIERLSQESVALAARIRDSETTVAALEARIAALSVDEVKKADALRARQAEHNRTVAGLLRIARIPEAALLATPHSPAETARGAILMKAALGQIEHDAAALRTALADLARVRKELGDKRAALVEENATLVGVRDRLAALVAVKNGLQRDDADIRARAARIAALAAEARDVRELLERLGLARAEPMREPEPEPRIAAPPAVARVEPTPEPAPEPAAPAAPETVAAVPPSAQAPAEPPAAPSQAPAEESPPAAIAALPPPSESGLPANGRVVQRFGEVDPEGLVARGLTIETVPEAQVIAPRAGEIVFAGAFRGFGRLLIIQHGDGYHTLLSGFSRIDSAVGSRVLAGEPVGAMSAETDDRPVLYLELRLNGRPINPLPWLTAGTSKVSG
ncbi:MAG: murein hydrolase activator EnvC [Rhodospirillales bacterium]